MGKAQADIVLEGRAAAPGDGLVRLGRTLAAGQGDVAILGKDDVYRSRVVDHRLIPGQNLPDGQGRGVDALRQPDVILGDQPHEDEGKGGEHEKGGGVQQAVKDLEERGFQLFRSPEIEDQPCDLQDGQGQIGGMQDVKPHLGHKINGVGKQGQQGHGDQPNAGKTLFDAHPFCPLSRFCRRSSCRSALKESNCDSTQTSSSSAALSVRYCRAFFHSRTGAKPSWLLDRNSRT